VADGFLFIDVLEVSIRGTVNGFR